MDDMKERGYTGYRGFWPLALLWLPAGIVATVVIHLMLDTAQPREIEMWLPMVLMAAPSLIVIGPCGLPLALACRQLWRLGFRRAAWATGAVLGAVIVAASLLAGVLGPLVIVVPAAVLSLPVWVAALWLAWRG